MKLISVDIFIPACDHCGRDESPAYHHLEISDRNRTILATAGLDLDALLDVGVETTTAKLADVFQRVQNNILTDPKKYSQMIYGNSRYFSYEVIIHKLEQFISDCNQYPDGIVKVTTL